MDMVGGPRSWPRSPEGARAKSYELFEHTWIEIEIDLGRIARPNRPLECSRALRRLVREAQAFVGFNNTARVLVLLVPGHLRLISGVVGRLACSRGRLPLILQPPRDAS